MTDIAASIAMAAQAASNAYVYGKLIADGSTLVGVLGFLTFVTLWGRAIIRLRNPAVKKP